MSLSNKELKKNTEDYYIGFTGEEDLCWICGKNCDNLIKFNTIRLCEVHFITNFLNIIESYGIGDLSLQKLRDVGNVLIEILLKDLKKKVK